MKIHKITPRVIIVLLLCAVMGMYHIHAKQTEENIWQIKENLTFRLGAEWYKIGILSHEISSLSDILTEIRDLELYPISLTGFVENELIQFDKNIEILEKLVSEQQKRIDELKGPLSDAIAIQRELVGGESVKSMFEVLEKGDLNRINIMLSIKHDINNLWKHSDTLFDKLFLNAGMSISKKEVYGLFDEEFFSILKANIGQTRQDYYNKLNSLKSHIISKATQSEIEEIYKIERNRILEHLNKNNQQIAYQKISDLIQRLKGRRSCDEMYLLLAKIDLMKNNYNSTLEILSKITESEATKNLVTLYKMQCYYALKLYDNILSEAAILDIKSFTEKSRNMLLWITIESALALKSTDYPVSPLATYVVKNSSYALHTMHAFARTLLFKGDTTTALSALESTRSYSVNSPEDKTAREQIELTMAHIYYETGDYETALTQFYTILKSESMYANALFGILWCYIQTGQTSKAEIALRKLINQIPESPLATESILILAKRYLNKAESSWKKRIYLEREEVRLNSLLKKINDYSLKDTSMAKSTQFKIAKEELDKLTIRIHSEPRETYQQIAASYDHIQNVCNLVARHYQSGTFQETSFSRQRESLLYYIDSVLIEIKNDKLQSNSERKLLNVSKDRSYIKNVVDESISFAAIALIDKYRWEREYIDNEKAELSKSVQLSDANAKTLIDSLSLKENVRYKDSLSNQMNVLLKKEDALHESYFNELTKRLRILISADIKSEDRAYFTYQLGELYYSHENRIYSNSYDLYELSYNVFESKLKAFRKGTLLELPLEPSAPRLDHDTSMIYFKAIVNSIEPSMYTHAAQYSLAWCYNDLSQFDSALYHMEIVAEKYPSSVHNAQAWMYCGEHYFDKGILDKSIECYHAVMRYPESEWFDEALYKQAWAQYRLSNPEKAISSFLALVELGEGNQLGQSLLEKESMDYIAISFSETDPTGSGGLDRALAFINKLGNVDRGCKILQRLASVYKEQGRYDMARNTLLSLLETYPYYSGSPQIEFDLISILERDESPTGINNKKFSYYKHYSSKSQWALSQKDTQVVFVADSLSERMLYESSIGFHQLALQKNTPSLYTTALETYREYIHSYPTSSLANECHYNLAEIQFSIGNYKEAAEEYIAVSMRYPDSKYKETAAWNAIVASQNLLKQEQSIK